MEYKDELCKEYLDEEEAEELQHWLEEISQWKLKPLSKIEACCSLCNKKVILEDMGFDGALQTLKNAGWELCDGPCCADCIIKQKGL